MLVGERASFCHGGCLWHLVSAAWGWGELEEAQLRQVAGRLTSTRYFLLFLLGENKRAGGTELFTLPRVGLDPRHIKFQAGRLGLSKFLL